jgi:hypothetical protein
MDTAAGCTKPTSKCGVHCIYHTTKRNEVEEPEEVIGILYNFRDVSFATEKCDHTKILPGRMYRSSCISRTALDVSQAQKVIQFLAYSVEIKTIIDLRSNDEIPRLPAEALIQKLWPECRMKDSYFIEGKKRIHTALIGNRLKIQGLFWNSPLLAKSRTIRAAFSGTAKETFAREVFNQVGLVGMNELILQYSAPKIVKILRLVSNKRNHPVMIHCSSGKDRTGLVIAILLLAIGISESCVLENYHQSDFYLREIENEIIQDNRKKGLDQNFDFTPEIIMKKTIAFINNTWGSVSHYLEMYGFSKKEQQNLAEALAS